MERLNSGFLVPYLFAMLSTPAKIVFPFEHGRTCIGMVRAFERDLLAALQADAALSASWRVPGTPEMIRWGKNQRGNISDKALGRSQRGEVLLREIIIMGTVWYRGPEVLPKTIERDALRSAGTGIIDRASQFAPRPLSCRHRTRRSCQHCRDFQ
jgi:hypothetical protein